MQTRLTVTAVVAVLAVITGVLVYQGRDHNPAGVSQNVTESSSTSRPTTAAPSTTEPVPSSSAAAQAPGRAATNVPMRKLEPGEQPPQFVIFSFDGAGSHEKWQEFLAAAEPNDARFVGFLTGIYLLDVKNRDTYVGPGHDPGRASVSFAENEDRIATLIGDLNEGYARGMEIGTHYNGHFCEGADPSGNVWTADDWIDELDQFFAFVNDYATLNPGSDLPELEVPAKSIKGGRTPCLEGQWEELVPAWASHGFTYDSSIPNPVSGLTWPKKVDGIWEFYMPYVYSPGFDSMVMAMDYNFWIKFNGGVTDPETQDELTSAITETYEYLYEQAFGGNRAPVLVANHFNSWNGNAFNPAVADFMRSACGRPDTYCATYSDVIAWMELQDPEVLKGILNQAPVADSAP